MVEVAGAIAVGAGFVSWGLWGQWGCVCGWVWVREYRDCECVDASECVGRAPLVAVGFGCSPVGSGRGCGSLTCPKPLATWGVGPCVAAGWEDLANKLVNRIG